MRCFVSIKVGEEALSQLSAAVGDLSGKLGFGKWVRPENMHLTLSFLGEVASERVPELQQALEGVTVQHQPFRLELASLGTFPEKGRPRVLWIGIQGDEEALKALQKSVRAAVEPFSETAADEAYRPHITLARFRELDGRQAGQVRGLRLNPDPAPWHVTEIELMESALHRSGAQYRCQFRVALRSQ
jgi:RNA 2',3'-cyclic 3'-phosphodiesterase